MATRATPSPSPRSLEHPPHVPIEQGAHARDREARPRVLPQRHLVRRSPADAQGELNPGAIIVSDNMLEPESAREAVLRYRSAVRAKAKMTSILVPVGSGLEISRYDA